MSITLIIYLISVLSWISISICIIIVFFIAIILLATHSLSELDEDEAKDRIKAVKEGFIIVFFLLIVTTLIPSEKSMWLMLGASKIERAEIPEKALKIIDMKLEQMIKEGNNVN